MIDGLNLIGVVVWWFGIRAFVVVEVGIWWRDMGFMCWWCRRWVVACHPCFLLTMWMF